MNWPLRTILAELLLRIRGKRVVRTGICNRCGACCRNILLEIRGSVISSREHFSRIVADHPEYARLKLVESPDKGALVFCCMWLREDNTCCDHENRLPVCRTYPAPGLFFAMKDLPADCGYRLSAAVPFERTFKRKLKELSRLEKD